MAAEFALVAADRGRLDALADAGDRRARTARNVMRRAAFHLSGVQFGITVASLLLGFVAEPSIAHLIEPALGSFLSHGAAAVIGVIIALVLATFLEMVIGELVPKSLAIASPERAALLLAPALRIYSAIFGPLITVLNNAANGVVRALGIEPKEELESVRSLAELGLLIEASAEEGTIADAASRLFARSIRFTEKCAADVLVPRVELHGIAADAMVSDLVTLSVQTGHSRFPVFRTDLDDIVGVVLVKSVHPLAPAERATTRVGAIMGPVDVVPETRALQPLLHDMQASRNHLMVVVDEYGGTSGIVTLEDLLEEIVGEIDDEYDPLTPIFTSSGVPDRGLSRTIPASLHPDEVEEATGFAMPDGEYETLAGFVLDQLGHLPDVGETITYGRWSITVEAVDKRRITEVSVIDGGEQEPELGS